MLGRSECTDERPLPNVPLQADWRRTWRGNGHLKPVPTTDSRSVNSVGFNYKPGGEDNR